MRVTIKSLPSAVSTITDEKGTQVFLTAFPLGKTSLELTQTDIRGLYSRETKNKTYPNTKTAYQRHFPQKGFFKLHKNHPGMNEKMGPEKDSELATHFLLELHSNHSGQMFGNNADCPNDLPKHTKPGLKAVLTSLMHTQALGTNHLCS